jgi:hypothetical protein
VSLPVEKLPERVVDISPSSLDSKSINILLEKLPGRVVDISPPSLDSKNINILLEKLPGRVVDISQPSLDSKSINILPLHLCAFMACCRVKFTFRRLQRSFPEENNVALF